MKLLLVTAVICSALALALGVPVPAANPDPAPVPAAQPDPEPAAQPKTDIELMKIPLDGDKELDVITLVNSDDQKINERNKRTIGILRELFPTISQILDQKIQMITSYLFRTIGPILLRSGLGLSGGGGGADGNRGGSSSSDDDDDDFDFDDDDDDAAKKPSSGSSSSSGGPKVSISLPTFPPSDDFNDDDEDDGKGKDGTTPLPDLRLGGDGDEKNEVRKRATTADPRPTDNDRIDLLAALEPTSTVPSETESNLITTNDNANTLETLDLAGLTDTLNAIRVARAASDEKAASSNDQNAAETSANSSSLDELTLDSEGNEEDRNKRFLSFGGSSGGGGGSGNFLFDIIRRAADRAARAAGTVYRVVAGTESLTTALENDDSNDDGHSTSSSATSHSHSSLVSGSSGTEQSDEKAHSPDDHDLGKGDGYTEGIPGPVTRLFVLANRGLSNLIQDLILPALFDASSPTVALPALPSLPGELSNMTAVLANTLNSLNVLGANDGNGSLASALEDELSAVRSLATAIGAGLVANLPSLPGAGPALTADIPRAGKQQESRPKGPESQPREPTTKPPPQSEPEQISLPLFSFF